MDVSKSKFIDLHVHVGPEIIPRRFSVRELIKEENGKIAGMALKNHFYPTVALIDRDYERELVKGMPVIGSVTLNNYMGGLNPDIIRASSQISERPIIVWLPTISAKNFLEKSKYEIPPEWVGEGFRARLSSEVEGIKITEQGGLKEDAQRVLEAVRDNNCILATGHISWRETEILVKEAKRMGISKIIVTHPTYQIIDMPLRVQKALARREGVYIEHCYAMYLIDRIPIQKIVDQIKAVGAENCILSSDMGQIGNPSPSEAIKNFTELLAQRGVTEEELRVMGEVNPKKILGLDR